MSQSAIDLTRGERIGALEQQQAAIAARLARAEQAVADLTARLEARCPAPDRPA